ncbi:MAG TPA: glycosyltransferase family A protein [Elusimicrobiota bacterium]|jgi:hypothetical protein|nr:glycosyltransferase family A protein [Elusimicrobiota bacterium]
MSPTLSVVLPHYNHGRYVAGCLEALLGQSRPPDELIVIDDASTDGSMPILESFAKRPGVRLVRHERNMGCARSCADGLSLCGGDYIFMPAADDWVLPGFFEKSMAALAAHPEAGISCTLAGLADEEGRDLGLYRTPVVRDRAAYLSPREFIEEYRRHGNWVTSTSVIFRRDAVLEAGGWPAELGPTVDGYLVNALASRYGVCFIPEKLVMWRRLLNSMGYTFCRSGAEAIALLETLDAKLAALGPPRVPPEHLALLMRHGLDISLDGLTRRDPFPSEEARQVAARIPGGGAALRLYRLALALGGGWAATKLYVFSLLTPREQARSIAGKLREALGPGGAER